MISFIGYAALLAALAGLAALFAERTLAELGGPRRIVWILAMAGSVFLPVAAMVGFETTSGQAQLDRSLPFSIELFPPVLPVDAGVGAELASGSTDPGTGGLDDALLAGWVGTSSLTFFLFLLGLVRLARTVRRSKKRNVGITQVLVSDRIGPAVVGFFRPRIVLPDWIMSADDGLRALVLQHESEHVRARDQLTLLVALLLVMLMPWNLALWWQHRRLRAAIEVDCDARVLRSGADDLGYSQALLSVRERSAGAPFGAVALTEPASQLERRIRIMFDRAKNLSLTRFAFSLMAALSVVALSAAIEAPRAQSQSDALQASDSQTGEPQTTPIRIAQADAADAQARSGLKVIPTIRTDAYNMLNAAQECLDVEDFVCARAQLDVMGQQDLNDYERAQHWNFIAFLAFEQDDMDAAIDAYENVLAINHANMPDGMIEQTTRNLGSLYASKGQHEQALEMANALLELRGVGALNVERPGFRVSDGEYLPIVKVAPVYPSAARARGLEGYVVVSYTVTANGSTADVSVVESSNDIFESAAVESALKYKYKPRVIDGTPVPVAGVTTRIEFSQ
jgi:TonB family protein